MLDQWKDFGTVLRRLLLGWLTAAAVELLLLPGALHTLEGTDALEQMSFLRLLLEWAAVFLLLQLSGKYLHASWERWALAGVCCVLCICALSFSFTWAFLCICVLLLSGTVVYARFGWNGDGVRFLRRNQPSRLWFLTVLGLGAAFAVFVSAWTVGRVNSFSTPTYDFGIFSQMFYNMLENGAPMTTVERDGLLSHFHVHMSPIYYLMLPFYALFPAPATLQVLQAVILASAVIPLWKLAKLHNLSPMQSALLCAAALLLPAISGGTSYDVHENCFLTPLLLWLLYSIDRKSIPVTAVAAVLTCMVKEDAAVYVAVVALWLILSAALRKHGKKQLLTGISLLGFSLVWFFAVTAYLSSAGDGVMTYRYENFMFGGSHSLVTVVIAALKHPMKVLFECVDAEKLSYIGLTLLPLLGLPLLTRRFERYVLLIPYILVNLMSDYRYQHDVMFQYNFGSSALLLYLTAVNLEDLRGERTRLMALGCAVLVSAACFAGAIVPTAMRYARQPFQYAAYYDSIRESLALVPEDAAVSSTTYYTTFLSQRQVLYDVRYAVKAHILETEYVVFSAKNGSEYKKYATNDENGLDNFIKFLVSNGYAPYHELEGVLFIYRKSQ